ncbi:MAG: tetratricopeptide repeat protein [Clostridiaceae bacterium]
MAKNTINKKPIIISILAIVIVVILVTININAINNRRYKQSLWLAQRYLDDKEYERSIEEYNKALEEKPDNLEARLGVSKAYTMLKRYDEAERILVEGESVLKDNVKYFEYLTDLYASQDRVDDVYNLLTKEYDDTKDEKFKELFYKYYDIAFAGEKYIVRTGDKVKFKTLIVDKNKSTKKVLNLDYSVEGDNLGEIKKEKDYLQLTVANNGKETIKINTGFIDEKIKIISIKDIDIKEKSTSYSVDSELEFEVVGKGKPIVDTTKNNADTSNSSTKNNSTNNSNKTSTGTTNNTDIDITLESLNNKFILNSSGNVDKYNEAVPKITVNSEVLQLLPANSENSSVFQFKAKAIKKGLTNINVVFDVYKKSLSKNVK